MLTSHQIPEPALATPREHQSEPGPVPAIRRSRRVRRAPERLVYLTTYLWTDYTYCHQGFFLYNAVILILCATTFSYNELKKIQVTFLKRPLCFKYLLFKT